jgi:hypothetical protein
MSDKAQATASRRPDVRPSRRDEHGSYSNVLPKIEKASRYAPSDSSTPTRSPYRRRVEHVPALAVLQPLYRLNKCKLAVTKRHFQVHCRSTTTKSSF